MPRNVNGFYVDALWELRSAGVKQETRNGEARALPYPTILEMTKPNERVLFCPRRKANPYFHVMETVWMFAGDNDIGWLKQFNQGIARYAEPSGTINGAYGYRWKYHFGHNQIATIVKELSEDPNSRQAVMGMYDPQVDYLKKWKDRPCNTHIYFRIVNGCLDMLVCNRSNDVVWGMAGANAVHMTYLHELIASAIRVPLGSYRVVTNNLHIYQPHYGLMDCPASFDYYLDGVTTAPLITEDCDWYTFLWECREFIKEGSNRTYSNRWLERTVKPMYEHYMCRLNGDFDTYNLEEVEAGDWRKACELWRQWNGVGV